MYRIRPWLFVGKYRETGNPILLSSYEIGAMLQLADHSPQAGIKSLYLPVEDGYPLPPEKLRQGVDFVRAEKVEGKKVLVACGAGISRSVTFTIAVMHEEEGLSLVDAYAQILEIHPAAEPHPALWESLRSYYNDGIPYEDLWQEIHKRRQQKS